MNFNKERLLNNLHNKISKTVGHRVDLALSDARRIDKSSAHFMLAYNQNVPTTEEITDFFIRKFNAKITPLVSTARVYKDHGVVTVVASLLNITRNIEDAKGMKTVIADCSYLDANLQEMWEVTERNGKKVLARKLKDDIMSLVQARKNLMQDSSNGPKKTFAQVALGSNILKYLMLMEKGDTVNVLHEGKIYEDAMVQAVSDGDVKVDLKGKSITVPRPAILEVTSKAKQNAAKEQKKVEDYFTKAYGDPEYAKQLSKMKK